MAGFQPCNSPTRIAARLTSPEMDLIDLVHTILREAGYSTRRELAAPSQLFFENDTILGVVVIFPTASALAAGWQQQQDFFLRQHASSFRQAYEKAWNCYCAFLTADVPSAEASPNIDAIEED